MLSILVSPAGAQESLYQFTTPATFSTYSPDSVAVDSLGNLFVVIPTNNVILKVTPGGVVTTFAGSGTASYVNATGVAAGFSFPHEIAIDSGDNLYVADADNNAIRKITPGAVVTTVAGGSSVGHADGNGTSAEFQKPWGVTVDTSGNLYVADTYNNEIRKITPTGDVTTLAGSTTSGHADGTGSAASFQHPSSVAVDSAGNLYVADYSNQIIREVTPAGVVTTLAGAYAATGYVEGVGAAARFSGPQGVAVDRLGNVYVADSFNNAIRKITPDGTVSTFAGALASGSTDGDTATARFYALEGVTVDAMGNIYVADTGNNSIRKGTSIAPSITTQPVGQALFIGSSVTFSAAASGTAPLSYQWKKGGVAIPGATNSSYTIAAVAVVDAGDYTVVASNLAGSVTSNIATLTVNGAPSITTQPVTQSVVDGSSVTFSVIATGTGSLSYQWQKAGTAISGAITNTYTIAVVTTGDAGDYTVVVSNTAGPVTSSVATLTVTAVAPSITAQPASQSVVVGSSVSLSVTATGTAPLTYQWKKDGSVISGAIAATYTIAAVGSGDAGDYTVVVGNSASSVASNVATLAVNPAPIVPVITTQPLSLAVFAGTSTTFTSGASGTPTPSYQWQRNGVNISGATSANLTLTNIQVSDAGSYALVATNSAGSVTSQFAQLVVLVARPNAITYEAKVYPTAVTVGGNVNLDYLVTNTGTKNWDANHYLSVRDPNGTFVAFSPLIGAHSGDSRKVNLTFPAPTVAGTYTYIVQALESGVEFFPTQTTVTIDVLPVQPNGITYNANNFPISSTPGASLIFNYNVTNTGTKSWGANHSLSLRNGSGVYLQYSSLNGVAPGQSKTVNLSFTAPTAPGVYSYFVQALETGVESFTAQANLTLVVLAPQADAVVYTPTRLQGDVTPGATVNLRYSLSNAGTVAWGAKHYASLRDGNGTFLAFVPLSGVQPGDSTTVNFTFVAPSTPGPYVYYVQALEDGVQFFDNQDLVPLDVVVTPVANAIIYGATTFPVTVSPGATLSFIEQITNRGTQTWGAGHYLTLRDADSTFLGFPMIGGIIPNGGKTVAFTFTAPTSSGVYTYHVQAMEAGVEFFTESDDLVLIVK